MAYKTRIQNSFWAMFWIFITKILAPSFAKKLTEQKKEIAKGIAERAEFGTELKLHFGNNPEDYVLCAGAWDDDKLVIMTQVELDQRKNYKLTAGELELKFKPEAIQVLHPTAITAQATVR